MVPPMSGAIYPPPYTVVSMQNTLTTDIDLLAIRDLMRLTHESESAWRKRLGRRELPFIKLGANVRVKRADFEQWLQERTVPAGVRNR